LDVGGGHAAVSQRHQVIRQSLESANMDGNAAIFLVYHFPIDPPSFGMAMIISVISSSSALQNFSL
jgi:hypothetical protein